MKKLLPMSLFLMLSFSQVVMAIEPTGVDEDAYYARIDAPAVLTDEQLTTENTQGSVDCFYEENRANEACANERSELQRARAF